MLDTGEMQELKDAPVAKLNLKEMPTSALVDLAAAKKTKADYVKAELDVVCAEIQARADRYQTDRHIKFTEWPGEGRALASVTVAQKLDILNYFKLKELLGSALVDQKVKIEPSDIKYKIDEDFKRALIALVLGDYESGVTLQEVVDQSGWCADDPQKKGMLLKKLKGDYKKDKKAVLSALNMQDSEINIDEELYLIYQIRNWQLITAFFDESHLKEVEAAVKKCVAVDETVKIGLKVG